VYQLSFSPFLFLDRSNEKKDPKRSQAKMAKLVALREQLVLLSVDAFIVGSGDAHQSEYVCEADMRRQFISDFTGSAGTALITKDHGALLWTDGRYFLQASQELSSDWTLMKSGEPGVPEITEWLTKNMPAGSVIGVDPTLISAASAKSLMASLVAKGIVLKAIVDQRNPVDVVWEAHGARPAAPCAAMTIQDVATLAGKSHLDKISEVRAAMQKSSTSVQAFVVTMLDEIVWLLNVRGADVDFNPVTISYVVVTMQHGTHFFVDGGKLSEVVRAHLGDQITVHSYDAIDSFLADFIKQPATAVAVQNSNGKGEEEEKAAVAQASTPSPPPLPEVAAASTNKVGMDASQINWRLSLVLGEAAVPMTSPITLAKSLKNECELNGVRQSHIRDGAALTAFLHWLEVTVKAAPLSITEFDVAVKIEEFRQKIPHHVSPSFSTIAGYGSNGAIIHYKPEQATAAALGTDSLFLLDSGAQYRDGTTDVTRTVHFGEPTQRMKDCYTMVLKGHIALATVVFPEGTHGSRLDTLARTSLWTAGLDYNHGTGHGVGAYLNVHEGPQGIGFRRRENEVGFFEGMTTSNEPGYYEEGAFGIRIENVCITVKAETQNNFGGKKFCAFETVTMTPIKTSLINLDMLNEAEKKWLNTYHAQVRAHLTPLVANMFPDALDYLVRETEPI